MKALILTSLLAVAIAAPLSARDDERGKMRQEFSGVAVSIGTPGNPTGVAPVAIVVTRWSTAEERQRLISAFSGEGQSAAVDQLQDMKAVGTIRVNNQGLAYDLRYAREFKTEDGGRRIFLLTDRPISAWEAFVQPRYSDYPFTLIEMRLDRDGHGSGTITLAAKITASEDGRFVQIENYATSPIQLNEIKQTK
jgi:hypothetical protein